MHLRPISCPPGLWSVLLLPLSTDTRKQRSGVWPAGRNGVCLVCLAVATSLLWHSLVTSKLGTPCSQPSSKQGNAELPPVQPAEHMQAPNQEGASESRETEHAHATHRHLHQTRRSCTAGAACQPHTPRARCCGSIRQAAQLRVGANAGVRL
jgi:hypothetical protein